jgi:PQQ-dependent dehydrogenase (methanol/ethanol family)
MKSVLWILASAGLFIPVALAQVQNYQPVTQDMLVNPSPNDWLMYSRTYDAQRFSPLTQINRQNVSQLGLAWSRGLGAGATETIPLVRNGVMYVVAPGAAVEALDATTGDLLWEYKRKLANPGQAASARTKTIAIYQDVVIYTAPDSYVVGLDARTGEQRWQTKADDRGHTSGALVVDGKAVTAGTCAGGLRANCYISAYDALTGKEEWRFYTTQGADDPNPDTWGGAPVEKRTASTWGLPGTFDPVKNILYWGVANPTPNSRMARHGGKWDAISTSSPADLYSNSTLALDPATGKLKWYYQHLPGDDWDEDYTHERTLFRTAFNPDPKFVKWFNPDVKRGEQRDVAVMVGEGGGVFALDRNNGQFLWATPFPFDTPEFLISKIDGKTGKVYLNEDLIFKQPKQEHLICFYNTRSYWPTAYSPQTNSLYVPYTDTCLDNVEGGKRANAMRPEADPQHLAGLAKINMSTGQIDHWSWGRAPSNGAVVATAGGLVFNGDLNRRFRAFDAESGKVLWQTILGGSISVSTITYAVNGKQYVAVMTGDGLLTQGLVRQVAPEIKTVAGHNAIYVFALPEK